jgi:hypothetical protein
MGIPMKQRLLWALTALLPACGGGSALVPDFLLPDVNTNSSTFGADVSPRDYLGRISAWYFGHAT